MRRPSLHESAVFWCAIASGVIVIGGILSAVGVARTPARASIWSDGWFIAGFALVLVGAAGLLWALVLHIANREGSRARADAAPTASAGRDAAEASAPEWRPPVEPRALARYLDEVNRTMAEHGFGPQRASPPGAIKEPADPTPSWEALNDARIKRYEENAGLFLVHEWVPSALDGQVADVTIKLCQHGEGPLSRGEIRVVEYSLGPKFTNHALVCTSAETGFATEVSMWGPMLCMAKVYFVDNRPPLILDRYIDFRDTRTELDDSKTPSPEAATRAPDLAGRLQDILRRGRRIRATVTIPVDGSSAPIEMWEQDVLISLEEAQRHDLLARFEQKNFSDTARGIISSAWATRERMNRKLALVSEFVRELNAG